MNTKHHTGCLVSSNGTLVFTRKDRAKYAQHFAKVGIHIDSIKTEQQFDHAWGKSRPFINDFLAAIASDGDCSNPERQALIEIAKGNPDRADAIMRRHGKD